MNTRNKKVIYTLIGIAAVILVTIGITYAYWLITKKQTGENIITSACLDISLTNEENDITLSNQFPLSDADGMKLTPYEFTVTNNCNTSVDYQIALETFEGTDTISPSAIKVMIDSDTPALLSTSEKLETRITNATNAYFLKYGMLTSKDTEGSSASHTLRLWIDADAPISEMNKSFESKITVTIGQGIVAGSSLAALVTADAQINNYLYTTTPDFSKVTADGEYGLYTAQDDYGTSYYFRGDIENNYVLFEEYRSAFLPSNISLEGVEEGFGSEQAPTFKAFFESMVFSTESACTSFARRIFGVELWTDCSEQKNLNTVYSSNTGIEEELLFLGYNSESNCIDGTSLTLGETIEACTEKNVEVGMYPSMYWRIVRINGDGTVRLILNESIGKSEFDDYSDSTYDSITYKYTYTIDNNGVREDTTIKDFLDNWYVNYLKKNYDSYIADSVFCNDTATNNNKLESNLPNLACPQKEDRYTVDDTLKGNGYLTYPIGLITADEVMMSGRVYGNSPSSWTGDDAMWTMTPTGRTCFSMGESSGGGSYCFNYGIGIYIAFNTENNKNIFYSTYASNSLHTYPVINIKTGILFTGSGTIDDPYKLVN